MGAAKPCLGFPSRTAAALALKSGGKSNRQIADLIGINVSTVAALLTSGRRMDCHGARQIAVPLALLEDLDAHAAVRGISVAALVNAILRAIADDDLVDAVLDDDYLVDAVLDDDEALKAARRG